MIHSKDKGIYLNQFNKNINLAEFKEKVENMNLLIDEMCLNSFLKRITNEEFVNDGIIDFNLFINDLGNSLN